MPDLNLQYAAAVNVLAKRKIADEIRYGHDLASRESSRVLPPDARLAVKARLAEIEAEMRPSVQEYERAWDTVTFGIGVES